MGRREEQRRRRLRGIGAVGTLAGAIPIGLLAARRRRASTGATSGHPPKAPGPASPQEWHCECGQAFRISGGDRHRILWLRDAAPEDPVVDDRCPACERELSAQA